MPVPFRRRVPARRAAGRPAPHTSADPYTELGRAHADNVSLRHQLAATRARLSDEKALTRQLRTALALAPFAQRASLWLALLWRYP